MRTTLLFLAVFLLACEAGPPAAAAPTEIPSQTPEIALSATSTPISANTPPAPVPNNLTPAPTPTVINATGYLRLLQDFGSEFWSGTEYTCDVEDYLGACVAYDEAERTHIYFEINFWNREATTIRIGERNEDWIAGCTYPDFEHWNKALGHFSKECSDRRVEKGKAVAWLNKVLAEKWPALVGDRVVPPTPTPRPSPTPFPTTFRIVEPTPVIPDGLNPAVRDMYIERAEHLGSNIEITTEGEYTHERIEFDAYEQYTIILTTWKNQLAKVKMTWATEHIPEELELIEYMIDSTLDAPELTARCVFNAYPDNVPLTVHGDHFAADAKREEDGRFSLTYTSWEFVPAIDPNDPPMRCE